MKTTGETIELRNLSIGYQTKHGIKTVATGIDGTIKSGELTCLLGANGVGKSTINMAILLACGSKNPELKDLI